jgi:plastocyanin
MLTLAVGRARLTVGVSVVLGYLALSAASALGASTVTVAVGGTSFTFTQPNVAINPGDSIHWVWNGTHHSVTSGALPPSFNGAFDAGVQSAGATFNHTFTQPGVYHYFCRIHYALGMRGTITVAGVAPLPTAAFAPSSTTPTAGQAVSFDASASAPPSGDTLESYAWDFGDGSTQVTTTASTTHVYATAGAHTVSLTVTDDGSAVSPAVTQALSVQVPPDLPPTARFKASPSKPVVGHPVSFDASGSAATVGQTIASFRWDFGDGATAVTAAPTVTHSYAAAGPFSATLVVVDGLGMASSQFSAPLTIGLPPPVATKPRLGAVNLCTRRTKHCPHVGTSVSFTLSRAASVKVLILRGTRQVRRKTVKGHAGKNSFKLSAAGLRIGSYKLVLTPSGGRAVTTSFKIRKG